MMPARPGRNMRAAWFFVLCMLLVFGPMSVIYGQSLGNARDQSRYDLHIPLTEQERAYLAGLPVLRIGFDSNWPPYAFLNAKGQLDGISADYLRYIVQTLHIKVKRVPSSSWSDTVRLANNGQVDVLIAMSQSNQLTTPFLATQPYIDYPEVIVTGKHTQPVRNIRDLTGLRVAMVKDSGAGVAPGLDTSVSFRPMDVGSVEEGLQAVATGKAQAFVGNLGVVERLIRQRYAGVLQVSGATGYSQSLTFGVAPAYEPLRVLMDRVFKAISEEDRERIQNTWLSASLQYGIPSRTLWEVLTPIGIVVLISIIGLSLIITYLRIEIRQRRWTEEELRFQIKFQQSLMETAPIPVFVKDLKGRYISVNPAFESIVGRKAEALLGRTASEVHPKHVASNDRLEVITHEVLSSGEMAHGELQYRSNAGDTRDVIYWLQLVTEEQRKPRALLGILVDVSALRAIEREQRALKRQLMELTQVLPALLFQVSYTRGEGFTPIFLSEYAEQLVGLKQQELMSSPERWLSMISMTTRLRLLFTLLRARRSNAPVEQELEIRLEDGRHIWVRLRAACHQNAPHACIYTGYLYDITQLKLQTESLARAKQDAERASRVKDVFLATMSHEIRTPMSGVIGILDLMDRGRMHTDDQHLLDMARGAAHALLRVLNDVLDFSKSQSGRLSMESKPFSLRTIIDEVMGLFAPEMQQKGLQFDVFVSSLVATGYMGDGQRIAQVLMNLVGNSLKFTDRGCIGMVVEAQPVDNVTQTQSLSITVRDTGVGISEEEQARLFEPFVQVGARHQGGTGLGLAICRRLIDAMDGSIQLSSAVGKGTSVQISLTLPVETNAMVDPIDPSNGVATTPNPTRQMDSTVPQVSSRLAWMIPEKSILMVEDQAINRELLIRQVESLGISQFDVEENGLDAWKAHEVHHYDLVMTDCAMPGMDGETLIRRIRAEEKVTGRTAYLVALTANAMESQRQACLDAGANEVIVKPVSLDQLSVIMNRVFPPIPTSVASASQPPEGISAEEWPTLRTRILSDMANELETARDAISLQAWKRAWEAVHRILGVARWFKLSEIASLAESIQAELEGGGYAERVLLEPLENAVTRLRNGDLG